MNLTELRNTLEDKRAIAEKTKEAYLKVVARSASDADAVEQRSVLSKELDVARGDVAALEAEVREMEMNLKPTVKTLSALDDVQARAQFFRSVANGEAPSEQVKRFLGAVDGGAAMGNGKNLLPVNIQTSIITDPGVVNPLRQLANYTMINGLQLPTLTNESFEEAKSLLKDGESGHELTLKAGMIEFNPSRFAVYTRVSAQMLRSTDVALDAFIRETLGKELANKERLSALGTPEAGKEHMNLFHVGNAVPVTEVATTITTEAEDLYAALLDAYYGLHQDYMAGAKIVMHQADYAKLRKFLANTNEALYDQGRRVLEGVEIVFDVEAKFDGKGILIGDFAQYRINYESTSGTIESQKDIVTGLVTIALEAYFDARIITPLAFKIIKKKVA